MGVKKKKTDRPDKFKAKIPETKKPPTPPSDLEELGDIDEWVIEQHAVRLGEESENLTEDVLNSRNLVDTTAVSAVPVKRTDDGLFHVIPTTERILTFKQLTENAVRIWITPTLEVMGENPPKLLWKDGEFVPEPTIWGRCDNCNTKQEVKDGSVCKWQGCKGSVRS